MNQATQQISSDPARDFANAVLAETDDWVAMASEFRSLAELPGIDEATIWEPAPAIVYTWSLGTP